MKTAKRAQKTKSSKRIESVPFLAANLDEQGRPQGT